MDANFWIQKWEKNEIAFHEGDANPLLVKHFKELSLVKASCVFVPLCGKTLDIAWLLAHGFRVAGAELSELAIKQLFAELKIRPSIINAAGMSRYSAQNIDVFAGNIFDLTQEALGPVDAVYDRAALVALPDDMRPHYARHLAAVTIQAPQLVISYVYDQKQMDGPPFSVTDAEVRRHYGEMYDARLLESVHVAGGLKGKCAATENVWLLKKRK